MFFVFNLEIFEGNGKRMRLRSILEGDDNLIRIVIITITIRTKDGYTI